MSSRTNLNTIIYWTKLAHEDWHMYLAATSKGICYVGSQGQPFEELADWSKKRFPATLIRDDEKLQGYADEYIQYLNGTRQSFNMPFDFRGTAFQQAVWQALCDIPYGQTKSYSDIADHIQKPSAVRAVGTAIGANPILIRIPCHRVIGKNGSLTGFRGGMDMKAKLLQLEKEAVSADRISQ